MRELLRAAVDEGKPLLGTFVKSADVELFEITLDAGFDFVIIDLQHSALTLRAVATLCAVGRRADASLIARIGPDQAGSVGRLLDVGIDGIQCADADLELGDQLRRRTSYPPDGTRSLSLSTRSARFGARSSSDQRAAARAVCIGQVESIEAVDNLDGMLASGAWHALFLGLVDLELDLAARRGNGALVTEAARAAATTILAAEIPLGVYVETVADAAAWAVLGASLIAVGSDLGLVAQGRRDQVARWHADERMGQNR